VATSYITNATLAQQITDLVNKWNTRELQMRVWLAGTATGGDFGNGTYPLTNYLNAVYYVASPAAMASGVGGSSTAAAASAAAALVSQNAANASAVNALASQTAAGTSATNAAASASTATTQASTAIGAQTNATNQAAIATAAALSASTSAQTAHIIYAEAEPGDEGPMGPTGRVGDTGPIGLRGPPGDDGVQGDDGLSISGPQGIQGPQGSIGMAGYDGDAGDDGMPGPQGLTGPPGPQGLVGLTGFDGDTGEEGLPGPLGLTGLTGAQGFSTFGIAGLDGEQGEEGMPIPGPVGPQGPQGLVGPAASTGGFEILFNEITQEDASFPGIPSIVGPLTVNGELRSSDIYSVRAGTPGTGVIYFGNSGSRFLYFNGSTYAFNGASLALNAGPESLQINSSAATRSSIQFQQNSGSSSYIGLDVAANLFAGTATGDLCYRSPSPQRWCVNNGTSAAMSLTTTGLGIGIGLLAPDSSLHVSLGTTAGLRIGYNGTSYNYYDGDTQYFRNGAQTVNYVIINAAGVVTGGTYGRTAISTGYMIGNYPSVETSTSPGCIYTLGIAYPPGTTTLGSMYGIGYTLASATLITGVTTAAGNWGMYVAANGVARIFFDASAGTVYALNIASNLVANPALTQYLKFASVTGQTYGTLQVNGATGGYTGIMLNDGVTGATFMTNTGTTGIYFQTAARWSCFDDGTLFQVTKPLFDNTRSKYYTISVDANAAGGGRISSQAGGTATGGLSGDIILIY